MYWCSDLHGVFPELAFLWSKNDRKEAKGSSRLPKVLIAILSDRALPSQGFRAEFSPPENMSISCSMN